MEKLETKKDGFDVSIKLMNDDNPNTSYLGEYTDNLEAGVIVRGGEYPGTFFEEWPDDTDLPAKGREYRGFRPEAAGEKVGTEDYKKYGMQDYKRMEKLNAGYWNFVGIIVTASKKGVELGHASLWGIESDDPTLKDLEKAAHEFGALQEAIDEAKSNLQSLQELPF